MITLHNVSRRLILTRTVVIAGFPKVDGLSELPQSDLCSYCNIEQYAMMQADAYTEDYDEDAKASYEYIAKACHLNVDNFNATDSAFNVTGPETTGDVCVSGSTYTTKEGDSCDSIALSEGVSAATLYYINSNIFDCHKIAAGTELCLPFTCSSLHKVRTGETCLDIAMDASIWKDDLITFNSQLNWNCTNLHDAEPFWGTVLCVSTPGGKYSSPPPDNAHQPIDSESPVDPPNGIPVADGTTDICSRWLAYGGSLDCTEICLKNKIAINLFTQVNPSLNKKTCNADLVEGKAYCVEPAPGWNLPWATGTRPPRPTATESLATPRSTATTTPGSSTSSATRASASAKVPSPTQPGAADDCSKWHYVEKGDGCYSIAEKYHLSLDDFYTWNSQVGEECSGLWLHYYVCVGTSS